MTDSSVYQRSQSNQSNRQPRDSKTKQEIFLRTTVCAIAEAQRPSKDGLDPETISKLFTAHMNYRHSHGTQLTCLEDRIVFKQPKFKRGSQIRNWVLYRDIEHYFVFPENRRMFMLGIRSDMDGQTLFETYKCKTEAQNNALFDLVCKARHDAMKWLHEGTEGTRLYSTLSEVSIHESAKSQSDLSKVDTISAENKSSDEDEYSSDEYSDDDDDVIGSVLDPLEFLELSSIDSPVRRMSSNERRPSLLLKSEAINKVSSSLAPRKEDNNEDDEEKIIYFDPHSSDGVKLNEEGPIYMFCRRTSVT